MKMKRQRRVVYLRMCVCVLVRDAGKGRKMEIPKGQCINRDGQFTVDLSVMRRCNESRRVVIAPPWKFEVFIS